VVELKEKNKFRFMGVLLAAAIAITYYVYFILRTHLVYDHLFYIPIIISAIWWKRKGLFVTIFLGVMLLLSDLFANNKIIADDVLRVMMFVIVGVITVILSEEISKREEALRKSQDRFESIVTTANDAIILMDNDGNITYWNDGAERIFGYSGQEVLNRQMHPIITPEKYHDALGKAFAAFRTTGEGMAIGKTLELQGKRKDGTVFPVELSVSALKLEGKWHSTGIVRDITERKLAEEALKGAKEFLDNLFTSMQDGFSILDSHGVHINVNPACCQMTGFSREELIGTGPPHPYWPPEEYEEIERTFQKALRCEFGSFELTFMRKNGERFPVIVSPSYIKNQQTNVISYFATFKDITERKKAEDELKKTYEELKKMQLQLIKTGKLAAMGELAAGITHELTQPLLGINGFVTALLEDLNNLNSKSPISDDDIRKFMEQSVSDLEIIRQQTDRMAVLLNRVRTFAHESGTGAKMIDIKSQIENAMALFSQQLRNHNIQVVTNFATGLPQIYGNANELQQVIINLISNAKDAMDDKGKGGQLTITTGKSDSIIYIEVEDTGTGADTETVSHMFEPSFTTKNGGMGLGLSIVHRIITDHGGTINAECRQGEGCKFTIHLPSGGNDRNG
jgi:PAS domain S-box-containing protein